MSDPARVGKPALEPHSRLHENLAHWLAHFLEFKAYSLGNHRADPDRLKEALSLLRKTASASERIPPNLDELKKMESMIRQAGVGISTQFHPAWRFVVWAKENLDDHAGVRDITEAEIFRYLVLATSSKSGATKANYRRSISGFFRFVSTHNREEVSLLPDISSWQRNADNTRLAPPDHLSADEVERFLAAVDTFDYGKGEKGEYLQPTYALLFRILLLGGLRISEALNLKPENLRAISRRDMEVAITTGKGNRFRKVRIPYCCNTPDDRYCVQPHHLELLRVRKLFGKNVPGYTVSEFLFTDHRGRQLYREKVAGVLKKIFWEAAINKKKMGPHLLRHTYASLLYGRTRDLLLVQKSLGHKDITMTQKYTHLWDSQLSKASEAIRMKGEAGED